MKILLIDQLPTSVLGVNPNTDEPVKYYEPFTCSPFEGLKTEDKTQPEYTHFAVIEVNGAIAYCYGDENLENTLKKLKLGWKWIA